MELSSLTAISPIDGRYAGKTAELRPVFSEFGMMRYRVLVEIEWLKTLSENMKIPEVPALSVSASKALDKIATGFSERDALRIKAF